ncbi:5963_t:CDS:10 [Ambispora gerdemannii]|uniref:5963_t:CDS:1 n=1 Tax=Ambispora gerdemannii TaxID=144530 RepID=A0A9N9GL14_9GLOM|nr:5963_t:CDS:10 [Ambispora gerdemannii]
MTKPSNSRRHRITNDVEKRLTIYIRQLLQQRTENNSEVAKKLELNTNTVFEYVQRVDYKFRRMKKLQLEQHIDSVLKSVNKQREASPIEEGTDERSENIDDEDNDEDVEDEGDDSEFEQLEGVQMMEVKSSTKLSSLPVTSSMPHSTISLSPSLASSITNDNNNDNNNSSINFDSLSLSSQYNHDNTPISQKMAAANNNHENNFQLATQALLNSAKLNNLNDNSNSNNSSSRGKNNAGLDNISLNKSIAPLPAARLSDLGGVDSCIEEVLELIAMPLAHPEIYLHTGVQPPRGILLHGPPGCGKTLLANAIAGELDVPFISISAPSVVSGMSGESEKKIREIFEDAKKTAPCLIFIDEIDAITPKRETAQREMERRIVAQLLTCMDDLSWEKTDNKPVLIIGATNRPDSLDPALRRAGRFDREISMGVPDEEGREKILKVISKKLRLSGDFDFKSLAKLTPGYVGADLNALTAAAGVIAVKRIFQRLGEDVDLRMSSSASFSSQKFPNNETNDAMQIDTEGSLSSSSINPTIITNNITSPPPAPTQNPFEKQSPTDQLRFISAFLKSHPDPLTPEELEPLSINNTDFIEALDKVQPSSKREGFATVPDVSWSDIGALSFVRDELRMAIVEPIKWPDLFEQVGITAPAGVLLWGPPGCGKTLLAKAVANESHTNFISVKGPELLNKYVGESERGIRQLFARARASSPCVIFFDELDALCPHRDESKSESTSRVVNTLLTELDGLESRRQVYVIAATNRPGKYPSKQQY